MKLLSESYKHGNHHINQRGVVRLSFGLFVSAKLYVMFCLKLLLFWLWLNNRIGQESAPEN